MRIAAVLSLFAFGLFLLWVARYRYREINLRAASLNSVQATVDSIASNGEFNLKYRVGSTDYQFVRSVSVNFFPRIRAGDTVELRYAADRPDTADVQHWSEIYADVAVAGGFGLVAIAGAVMVFVALFTGVSGEVLQPNQRNWNQATQPADMTFRGPIELATGRGALYSAVFVAPFAFGIAIFLFDNPQMAGRPWLADTGAGLIALSGIAMIVRAVQNQPVRIRAQQDGVGIRDSLGSREFKWEEVKLLKLVTRTERHYRKSRGGSYATIMAKYLILFDGKGNELLKLNEGVPLQPQDDWQRLLVYIPQRTGLPIIEETVENVFQRPQ